jgi:tol-pal system protein YbgF
VKGQAPFILVALGLLIGCASPMTALRDDNRRLNHSVSELRTERRAQERKIRDLQRQVDLARAKNVTAAFEGIPQLPVEVAGPDKPAITTNGSRVVGITEDGEEIVYEGDAAAGKVATLDDEPAPPPRPVRGNPPPINDRIEVRRSPPVAARSARTRARAERDLPTERSSDAANDYRDAVALVKGGDHDKAVTALRAFTQKYPRHDFADNAQYWLGEAFYAAKQYPQALVEFRAVIETYPRGNKVPDALLKVGYCYQALGQADKARAVLEQVVSLYPKTEPAALAGRRLENP